jgi:hypothetical protein
MRCSDHTPREPACDAPCDYDYFYYENDPVGGSAAVPFSKKGGYQQTGRRFTPE